MSKQTTHNGHTPLPWTFAYGAIYSGQCASERGGIRIALMDRDEPQTLPTERDANAAFIVRAVNSQERLLTLLSTCAAYLAQGDMAVTSRSIDGDAFKAELLDAINTAQRGSGCR